MTEIKVQCDCGQKFKFDVEPINGRMPFAVNCPICGSDGTAKANEVLSQVQFAPIPVAAALPVAVAVPAALAVPAAIAAPPVAPPPAAPPALRLNRAAPPAPVAAPAVAVPAPPVPGTIVPIGKRPAPPGTAAQTASGKKPNFGLGLAGALAGAAVGGIVYCAITYFIGFRLFMVSRFVAIGVGYLAGLGADLLGRKEGSKELGMITAVFALAAIFGAQYVNAKIWYRHRSDVSVTVNSVYEAAVAEAKKVVAAVPTGSDAEIRAYLAADAAGDSGEKADPAAVSAEDIKDFRETTLPLMRKLASGETTKEQFIGKTESQIGHNTTADDFSFAAYFMGLVVKRSNIFSLIAAAAMAYKVAAGNA
jgi:hypothetical protein